MHESTRSLRPAWIGFAWFVAVALASLVLLALEALGTIGADDASGGFWSAVALLVGFLVGGFFLGSRVAAAPLLHGLAMGAITAVAWGALALLGRAADLGAGSGAGAAALGWLFVLQLAAAVVGTRAGVRWVRRGNPEGRAAR